MINQVPPPYSPGILSLIPLYYIGWADSILSPGEVSLIRKKINELAHLSKEEKKLLHQWSDPSKPPSPSLFKQWVKLLKDAAEQLPGNTRQSLVGLGIEMARKSLPDNRSLKWDNQQTRQALEEIEEALGIIGLDGHRNILTWDGQQKPQKQTSPQASFDIDQMRSILDGPFAETKDQMRKLLSDPEFALQELPLKEDYRQQVLHWCQLLAERGLGALSYPKAQGGSDEMGKYIAVFEMLGYHDLSLTVKFGVQFGLFGGSILWLGTEKHHQKYLNEIGRLALPGCFAMTETGHGSNVRNLETTATYRASDQRFIIHSPSKSAGKEYIGNALHGQLATVFAQLIVGDQNYGIHALVVPIRDAEGQLAEGVHIEDCGYKLGLNGVDYGRIWFDQVVVPRENLLNRFGDVDENGQYHSSIDHPSKRFFTMLGTLVGGRVCVPQAGLSASKVGLTIAIKYGLKRRQFGPSDNEPETLILDYPSHQRRLMPLLAKTYALDFALGRLTERYLNRSEADIREIETLAAGLKSYSTWFTSEALQECREACGGKGYLAENRLAALKADTEIFTTFEGDNTVLMQLVAKGLLSSYREEFHNEGFRAIMRMLLEQMGHSLSTYNPISTRNTDSSHLSDPAFQLQSFQYRERKLLIALTQRMRNLLAKRIDPYDAFLRCQNHMIELAYAFIERVVLEQFQLGIEKSTDKACQVTLKKLCDLFALSTMESNIGWYLEQDYLQGIKAKAIRRMVDKRCAELRTEAGALVEAFAIPNSCLAAPIAL
ncbi:MAG: acyl-CoA dehydrogenase [Bacteroidota bacterium]